MESCQSQEPHPVFHLSPQTLQEMAASQCALDCWHNLIIMRNIDSDEILSVEWLKEHSSFSCTDIAPFPVGVRCLINRKIPLIRKAIGKWWSDHSLSFLKLSPGVMVNCVALNPAGDVSYKRTAKNLLTANPAPSLEEQFEIACKYCLEEDVERLWFLLENNDYYYERGFHELSLDSVDEIDYWCSKMRGELRESYYENRSPEWFVLLHHRHAMVTNWARVEYFWHKLNREAQSSFVSRLLLDRKFTKHLILELDDEMLGKLKRSELNSVFEILAADELCYEYVLQLWSYVNVKYTSIILENAFFLYEILIRLTQMAFHKAYFYGFHISSLLKEMWLSASDDFKNYVLCHPIHFEKLFERSLQSKDIRSFGIDVGFFIELLSGVSFEIRQQVWHRYWDKLFLLAPVSDILRVMTVCFNNSDDIVQFKKKYMMEDGKLRVIPREFIKWGCFDELIAYLKFCCSDDDDEKLAREKRKHLALLNFDRNTQGNSEPAFCKFLRFFHDSVSSADLAEVLNWEFQDKEANLLSMCILYDRGELRIFTRALRCFEFPDQRVIELKRFFFERCQHVLMSGDFNSFFVQDWESFLLWCTSSTENQNSLRDSITIDDLFENLLINMHKFFMDCRGTSVVKYRYSHKHVFNSIDRFLGWYFRDYEIATDKLFKYSKIIDYENSEAVKMLLNMENDKILRDVLLWFFDDKKCELKKFLVQFGHESYVWKGLRNVIVSLG